MLDFVVNICESVTVVLSKRIYLRMTGLRVYLKTEDLARIAASFFRRSFADQSLQNLCSGLYFNLCMLSLFRVCTFACVHISRSMHCYLYICYVKYLLFCIMNFQCTVLCLLVSCIKILCFLVHCERLWYALSI